MWEMESDDDTWSSWSLMAIVNESGTKTHDEVALNTTTTTAAAAATPIEPTIVVEPVSPIPNPSPFDTTQNNYNLFQNLSISSQIINASENNNPFQTPLISNEFNQFNAINDNSLLNNQSLIMPNKLDATYTSSNNSHGLPLLPVAGTRSNANACGHTFANLFQSISIPSQFKANLNLNPIPNPNPMAVEPLQDFVQVSDNVDDVPVFRNGLEQLKPPDKFLLPKRNSRLFKPSTQKKRKNLNKTVRIMTLNELLKGNDKWAWRKYGRKPIKGTPHPRNYYKCSSVKGCTAKKQVERNPADLNTYIVTFTGEHLHSTPRYKHTSRHRVKLYLSNPDAVVAADDDDNNDESPETPSPTDIAVDDHPKMDPADPPGSISRSEPDANLIILDDSDEDIPAAEGDDGGAEGNSNELGTNSESPNSILMTEMGRENEENVVLKDNASEFNNVGEYEYGYGYGFDENDLDMNINIIDFDLSSCEGYNIPDFDFLFNIG